MVSATCRAWLPWRGLRQPGDGLVMRLALGVTPTAADPVSTAARSCLVVVGWSSAPLPPGGSRSVLGEVVNILSTGLWSMAASSSIDEVDRRAAAWGPTDLPNKGEWPRVPLVQRCRPS
jgi:hypothetical protein